MSYQPWLPRCAICNKAVDLTESKTDEQGQAVHEACYVSMLTSTYKPFAVRALHRAIRSFVSGRASL
jgi:hypothetical protein